MPRLEVCLLGPFLVNLDGQPLTNFSTDAARYLLAYLAMHPGQAFDREFLAALLASGPNKDSFGNLRTTLYRLKQALSSQAAGLIQSDRRQVVFQPPPEFSLDVTTFTALAAEVTSHAHRKTTTCQACLGRLQQMARLYRGNFLENLRPTSSYLIEWRSEVSQQLLHQALPVFAELAERALQQKYYALAEAYAQQQLRWAPWSESTHRQLILALGLQDKRQAALLQYQACCNTLQETFGSEPDSQTNDLAKRLRIGAPLTETPAAVIYLPAPDRPIVGREDELASLTNWLNDPTQRLIIIHGPGGVGKSRLALEAAWESLEYFPAGACWINLPSSVRSAPPGSPLRATNSMLLPAIASALRLGATRVPLENQVIDFLRQRELLLVLDDLDALDTSGLAILKRLLQNAPRLAIIVTTVNRPEIPFAQTLALRGLAQEKFMDLFTERARHMGRPFEIELPLQAGLARIFADTDGLPLAAILLSAWTTLLAPEALAQLLLRDGLELITSSQAPHSTPDGLSLAFDKSWSLLSPEEQQALASLSVCVGEVEFGAAQAISLHGAETLAALHDKALLNFNPPDKYTLLPLVRRLAAVKRLQVSWSPEPASPASALDRHGRYYLGLLAEAATSLFGPSPRQPAERLRSQWGEVQQAWLWGIRQDPPDHLIETLPALVRLCEVTGQVEQGQAMLQVALEDSSHLPVKLAAWLLTVSASLQRMSSKLDIAMHHCQQAADLLPIVNDPELECYNTLCLSRLFLEYGAPKTTRRLVEDLLNRADLPLIARIEALTQSGYSLLQLNRVAAAEACFRQALELSNATGDQVAQIRLQRGLIQSYQQQGQLGQALEHIQQQLALARQLADPLSQCEAELRLGEILTHLGQAEAARSSLLQALEISRNLGSLQLQGQCLSALGILHHQNDDLLTAFGYLQSAIEGFREINQTNLEMQARLDLGELCLDTADMPLASKAFGAVLQYYLSSDQSALICRALVGLAQLDLWEHRADGTFPKEARQRLQNALPFLLADDASYLDIRPDVYWRAYQVLQALGETESASNVLQAAACRLERLATSIQDPALRRSFLENILVHRQIQTSIPIPGAAG